MFFCACVPAREFAMFTGIIQGLGRIMSVNRQGQERRFTIQPLFGMAEIQDGESIAVNGVCLSVESHAGNMFSVYASRETLRRSNLGELEPGSTPNLERALELGERVGGHLVSGHVDCIATVSQIGRAGQSLKMKLEFPPEFGPQVVGKGSVALNGISLTVNECGRDFLEVNVIPDSQKRTNILDWRAGSRINMETDIIGKYVQRMLSPWRTGALDREFLARHGFA